MIVVELFGVLLFIACVLLGWHVVKPKKIQKINNQLEKLDEIEDVVEATQTLKKRKREVSDKLNKAREEE